MRTFFNNCSGNKTAAQNLLNSNRLNSQRTKINETILKLMKKQRNRIENPFNLQKHFQKFKWNQVCFFLLLLVTI